MELDNGVSAGVNLRLLGNGLVPVYEEHDARIRAGISLERWGEMTETEKALIIADTRVRQAMKNLQTEAEIKKMEREAKTKTRKK